MPLCIVVRHSECFITENPAYSVSTKLQVYKIEFVYSVKNNNSLGPKLSNNLSFEDIEFIFRMV